jgi:predicted ABC-type ATPase
MLAEAADAGGKVHLWYVGLDSSERHIARVRQRVKAGGHDIPEADVRRRYETSRENLVWLMPKLASLYIYDNSIEADPASGRAPRLALVLHLEKGRIVAPSDLRSTPDWAKALVAKAILIDRRTKR